MKEGGQGPYRQVANRCFVLLPSALEKMVVADEARLPKEGNQTSCFPHTEDHFESNLQSSLLLSLQSN